MRAKEHKHTPGPWETVVIDPRFVFVGPVNKELRDSQGICEFLGEDKQANAKFIVKACNCHYELLEALVLLLDKFNSMAGQSGDMTAKEARALMLAHAAIDKAGS